MNKEKLKKHILNFKKTMDKDKEKSENDFQERKERIKYYQSWTKERIIAMTKEELYEYISKLWAMLIWGNKYYVVNKICEDNGFDNFKKNLADLLWGQLNIEKRWDHFRKNVKGMGPAMISEILCHTHPEEYIVWNRKAHIAFNYLNIKGLPKYDYQVTGKVYNSLCQKAKEILSEFKKYDFKESDLLTIDYFIWDELQIEIDISSLPLKEKGKEEDEISKMIPIETEFKHNDIRDKIWEIGRLLGFDAETEIKVAEGSQVDTIWEVKIGNMGRIIYVFEVQTKGSIDSLILNLFKSMNNPAVQGVVAVSDNPQLEKIKKHAANVGDLEKKLKYWDFEEVLKVHDSLTYVSDTINNLGLVPDSFKNFSYQQTTKRTS